MQPKRKTNMQFQLTQDRKDSNMTSNISHLLNDAECEEMYSITPELMSQTFGPGDDSLYEPERGYSDPEWYFKGPGGTVLGIGYRYGMTRLRGKNVENQFVTSQEVCATFLQQVLYSIELEQEDVGQ
jgi:hypothetical protein